MSALLLLSVLLCVGGQRSWSCPAPCSCHGGGLVNCSSRSLTSSSLPDTFPAATMDLRLHDNHLTSLPNGLLDALPSIRHVSLHNNPWVCDCGVLYLRAWLRRQPVASGSRRDVMCGSQSPAALRGRLVVDLTERELLDTCHYWLCDLALASQLCLLGLVLLQAGLLVALFVLLRRFAGMSREARGAREESFTAGERQQDENEYTALKDSGI